MKILVCISSVPDTTTKITFTNDNAELNSSGVQYIVNPYDEIALAKAVEMAEGGKAEVTVINVGDAGTDPTIRKALAIGADKAVRVDAQPKDAWFVAHQVADYAKKNNFDLILTGRESIDYNSAQVAGLVGELLNIPSVSIAKKVELQDQQIEVDREVEGGKEILSIPLPAVIGVSEGVAEPRIPNMRGIMSARSKPLDVVEAIAVEETSAIKKFETPEPRGAVTMIPADEPEKLVELLHTKARVI